MPMRDEIEAARKQATESIGRIARTFSEKLDERTSEESEADASNMAIALKAILKLGPEHIDGIHALARGAVTHHEERVNGRSP